MHEEATGRLAIKLIKVNQIQYKTLLNYTPITQTFLFTDAPSVRTSFQCYGQFTCMVTVKTKYIYLIESKLGKGAHLVSMLVVSSRHRPQQVSLRGSHSFASSGGEIEQEGERKAGRVEREGEGVGGEGSPNSLAVLFPSRACLETSTNVLSITFFLQCQQQQ